MAGNLTEVSTGKMSTVANSLEGAVSQYKASVNALYDCGAQIDAMWDGLAGDKFTTTFRGEKEKFDALAGSMTRYVQGLRENITEYTNGEQKVIDIVGSKRG